MNLKDALFNKSEAVFLISECTGLSYSYAQVGEIACRLASSLFAMGLSKGDHLVIFSENSVELCFLYFACMYAGIVIIPVSHKFPSYQLEFILHSSKARHIVCFSNVVLDCIIPLKLNEQKIIFYGETERVTLKITEQIIKYFLPIEPFKDVNPDDLAVIIYSSGTTAEPKGIQHSLANYILNGSAFIQITELNNSHRFYNILPMHYNAGFYNLLLLPCLAKASVVIGNAFSAASIFNFWSVVEKYNITVLWLVPSIMSMLMKLDRRSDVERQSLKSTVAFCFVGTAPLSVELKEMFSVKYNFPVVQTYGITEVNFISVQKINDAHSFNDGVLLDNVSVSIVDENKEPLCLSEEGELLINSDSLMLGYYNAATPGGNSITFSSGDVGFFDEMNRLHISGRRKDMIIRGGINISPAAIEGVVNIYPGVTESMAFGEPHELLGEMVSVIISLYEHVLPSTFFSDFSGYCKDKLASEQVPHKVYIVDKLPRNQTGKVIKAEALNMIKKQDGIILC